MTEGCQAQSLEGPSLEGWGLTASKARGQREDKERTKRNQGKEV